MSRLSRCLVDCVLKDYFSSVSGVLAPVQVTGGVGFGLVAILMHLEWVLHILINQMAVDPWPFANNYKILAKQIQTARTKTKCYTFLLENLMLLKASAISTADLNHCSLIV